MKAVLPSLVLASMFASSALAQNLEPIEINVVGNVGVTTQLNK